MDAGEMREFLESYFEHKGDNLSADDHFLLIYKAAEVPEEERTDEQRYWVKVGLMICSIIRVFSASVYDDEDEGEDDGEYEPEPFVSKAEPVANAVYDSLRDHVDKLHQEYEEMTGRKFAKPKWGKE